LQQLASITAGQLSQHDGEQVMMISQLIRINFAKVVLTTFCVALLAACGGGGGGGGSESSIDAVSSEVSGSTGDGPITGNQAVSSEVSGSIGDGPITGATVEIYNVRGELIGTETSDNAAAYKSTIKVNRRDYPLLLKVSDGVDLVTGDAPDFELVSVMMQSSNSTVNINPFSTLIVKMAQSMTGGVNAENISYSNAVVMEKFSFGLDSNINDNPVTTRISSKNIAQIVKSSEALGEMIRRTRDLITETGNSLSGDDVVNAIAADMADGFLDGAGAAGSDPTIAAVANVVTGQVLVEAMTNTLKVNGVIATVVIDQAISTTHPSVKSSQMSDSVRITSGLINQVQLSVAAAQVLDSSASLANLAAYIGGISANTSSTDAARVLPAGASQWLDYAVTKSATADTQNIVAINLVANNISPPVVEDTPPPVVENDPPPVVEDTPPPVVENDPPPVVEDTPPPVVENDPPPVVATTGNLNLSWTAPVAREDGAALSLADIDGYRIYYGASAGNYTQSVEITDGTAQSITVTGIPVGSYHVVMTTYDMDGRESGHSSSVIKSVQ
jgi:hypothetical protein